MPTELSYMDETSVKHVARGAALLDIKRPGWRTQIDAQGLDLTSPWSCILGQLFGDYLDGLRPMFGSELDFDGAYEAAVLHGFNWPADPGFTSLEWIRALERAWRDQLKVSG